MGRALKTPQQLLHSGSKPFRIVARMVAFYSVSEKQAREHLETRGTAVISEEQLTTYRAERSREETSAAKSAEQNKRIAAIGVVLDYAGFNVAGLKPADLETVYVEMMVRLEWSPLPGVPLFGKFDSGAALCDAIDSLSAAERNALHASCLAELDHDLDRKTRANLAWFNAVAERGRVPEYTRIHNELKNCPAVRNAERLKETENVRTL